MHYQHQFHAGNFADVFKHVLLVGLLEALNQKDNAWAYLDTHSGTGLYYLGNEAARRTGEAEHGISRVLADSAVLTTPWLQRYREIVIATGHECYPGSPSIAAACQREQDRLMLCEQVPAIAEELRRHLSGPNRAVHLRDGYGAWALLPPAEKRGLVLVDPPFEARDEYERLVRFASTALGRFSNGIYALWYPVKQRHAADAFVRRLTRAIGREAVDIRLFVSHPQDGRMRGCGLAVINPPYAFLQGAPAEMAALSILLAQGPGARHEIQMLTST